MLTSVHLDISKLALLSVVFRSVFLVNSYSSFFFQDICYHESKLFIEPTTVSTASLISLQQPIGKYCFYEFWWNNRFFWLPFLSGGDQCSRKFPTTIALAPNRILALISVLFGNDLRYVYFGCLSSVMRSFTKIYKRNFEISTKKV